jgi:hypothetical protein
MSDVLIRPKLYGGLPVTPESTGVLLVYFDHEKKALGLMLSLTAREISESTVVSFGRSDEDRQLEIKPPSSKANVVTLKPAEVKRLVKLFGKDGAGVTVCFDHPDGSRDCYQVEIFRCSPCPALRVTPPLAK